MHIHHTSTTIEPSTRRLQWAMFLASCSAFSLLYASQPLMPILATEFALGASESSWVLSISTLTLALSLLVSSVLSAYVDHRRLMVLALFGTAMATLGCALSQDYSQLLLLRAALGLALGGMPAIAITYLSQQTPAPQLSKTIGFYIAGTALGGMSGRILAAVLSEFIDWRLTFMLLGGAGLLAAALFQQLLPKPRKLLVQPDQAAGQNRSGVPEQQRRLPRVVVQVAALMLIGFLLAGCFTSLYNYISFRLLAPPYSLPSGVIGAVTLFYLFGIASSFWGGHLIQSYGQPRLLLLALMMMLIGLLLTLHSALGWILAGIAIFTFGYFAAHTMGSSWLASLALRQKSLVTAIYLGGNYLGTSVLGSVSGIAWQAGHWSLLVQMLAILILLGLLAAVFLLFQTRLMPPAGVRAE